MKKGKLGLIVLSAFLLLCSCESSGPSAVVIPPSGLLNSGSNTYKLWLPENFKNTGYGTKYPILISLHGGTSSTDYYFAPCIVDDKAESLKYPCVFIAPNSTAGLGTDVTWIREVIRDLIENPDYRIDSNRIYVIGFSMGAFGCTNMARDLYNDYGYFVAGIVPSGGGNYPDIPAPKGRLKTAMWTHYGLNGDFPQETDYDAAKAYLTGAVETVISDTPSFTGWDGVVYSFPRKTRTLSLNGVELFKISTYEGMGHGTGPIYEDPIVLDWLFDQSLSKR